MIIKEISVPHKELELRNWNSLSQTTKLWLTFFSLYPTPIVMINKIYQGSVYKAAVLALVVLPLLAVLAAIVLLWNRYVFLTDIFLLAGLYTITMLGETVGYHRMLTHQSFAAPAWVRACFLIAGAMSFTGDPLTWAGTHLKHHAHSDDDDDPHSPLKGFWHAHLGWLFNQKSFCSPTKVYAARLLEDPVAMFVHRTRFFWLGLSLLIPFAIGGWTGLLWGGGVRIFLMTHATWSVNSICHTFGRRAFDTTDVSRNNWLVGLLAFGEGWHNNHHAFPRSAFHGLRWWQFDLSALLIRLLEKGGLAWDVQRVNDSSIDAYHKRSAAMKNHLAELRKQLAEALTYARKETNKLITDSPSPRLLQAAEAIKKRLDHIQTSLTEASVLKKRFLQDRYKEVQILIEKTQALQPA